MTELSPGPWAWTGTDHEGDPVLLRDATGEVVLEASGTYGYDGYLVFRNELDKDFIVAAREELPRLRAFTHEVMTETRRQLYDADPLWQPAVDAIWIHDLAAKHGVSAT